jgi:hypothetical protein
MAGFTAIAAAGRSIERLLNLGFQEDPPIEGRTTRAVLVRSVDFEEANLPTAIGSPALSIFLYRVEFNKTMRAAWSSVGSQDGQAHLALDLHYLLTPWAANAEFEHRILGKAMQILESIPMLSGALLDASGDWAANETVQLLLDEITTEAIMRTFDSLPTDYRLSVPYIARMVRIDGLRATPEIPVTTLVTARTPGSRP